MPGKNSHKTGKNAAAHWSRALLHVERLESRTVLSNIYALTTSDTILRFDSNTPGTIDDTLTLSGLQPGEDLLGIDFRPATGQLYGLGSTSRLYTINLGTGAAVAVNTSPFSTLLSGTRFGFDFNPTVDRIRVVSDANQNLRINPNNGAVIVDANLNPGDPNVVASAYTNNFVGAAATTLFGIDSVSDNLVRQAPPNDGTLVVVGALGVDPADQIGFDIVGGGGPGTAGNAYAAFTAGAFTGLYNINLDTGEATLLGSIGNGLQDIDGLAAAANGFKFFAVGGGAGRVRLLEPDASLIVEFNAYGGSDREVYVAAGDLNRDGIPELVTSTATTSAHVKIFDGADFANGTFNSNNPDASLLTQFFAFSPSFNIGATIAVGDVTGDLINDLIIGAASGNPEVKIINGADIADGSFDPNNLGASTAFRFFAYGVNFNVGASVAVGDLDRDGFRELITGALPGNPHVKVFDGVAFSSGGSFDANNPDASAIASFFAYGINFNIGVFVSTGDTNGDGLIDLVTGASRGNPHVRVFDGDAFRTGTFDPSNAASSLTNFFAFELGTDVGVRVGVVDFDNDGIGEILCGSAGGVSRLRIFSGDAAGINANPMLDVNLGFTGSIAVAAS